jgi:hypothetical protein
MGGERFGSVAAPCFTFPTAWMVRFYINKILYGLCFPFLCLFVLGILVNILLAIFLNCV